MMMVQWKEGESSRLKRESKASKGRRKREGRSDESGGERERGKCQKNSAKLYQAMIPFACTVLKLSSK